MGEEEIVVFDPKRFFALFHRPGARRDEGDCDGGGVCKERDGEITYEGFMRMLTEGLSAEALLKGSVLSAAFRGWEVAKGEEKGSALRVMGKEGGAETVAKVRETLSLETIMVEQIARALIIKGAMRAAEIFYGEVWRAARMSPERGIELFVRAVTDEVIDEIMKESLEEVLKAGAGAEK